MKNQIKRKTLTLLDRVTLPTALPKQSDIKTMIIVHDINNKVKLTQKDIKDFDVTALAGNSIGWSEKGTLAKFDYEFTALEEQTIKEGLTAMNERKELTQDHIGLWNLFCK